MIGIVQMENEKMADYIDRQKLLKDIEQYHLSDGKFQHWVEVQPSADVQPVRHGFWIEDRYNDLDFVCSECGEPCANMVMGMPRDRYCKWCGARMAVKDG